MANPTKNPASASAPRRYSRREIVRDLETYIVDNQLAPGLKFPSGAEIANKYQVSLKTADRAMSVLVGKGLVGRKRGSGSYVKSNRVAKQQYRIGLFLWSHPGDENFSELTYAAFEYYTNNLTRLLSEHGFAYDVFYEDSKDKEKLKLFQLPLYNYDAIIAAAGVLDSGSAFLQRCPVPVILIHDDVVHPGPWHQVIYDYRPGFAAALKYFHKQGHRRFFIISSDLDDKNVSKRRVEAILEEAANLRLPSGNLIVHVGNNPIVNTPILCGRDSAAFYCSNNLLRYPVVSVSDFVTYGFLSYMREQKLEFGKDYKLISYDNLEKDFKNPSLRHGISGITHPKDEAVEATVELLESLITCKSPPKFYRTYFVPAKELVLRNSC